MKGIFITFEGPDGSGKTTQINLLKEYLDEKGYDIVITREPGGTRISEDIREVILDKKNVGMDRITEALLYAAARAQHVSEVIKPALAAGKAVICDRYIDSSIVYQGIGRGLGIDFIEKINSMAVQKIMPDVTLLLKIDPAEGLKRRKDSDVLNRLDLERLSFHEDVYRGYLTLESKYTDRIRSIDGSRSIEEVSKDIIQIVETIIRDNNNGI